MPRSPCTPHRRPHAEAPEAVKSYAHPSCSALRAAAEWARRGEERGGVVAATIDYQPPLTRGFDQGACFEEFRAGYVALHGAPALWDPMAVRVARLERALLLGGPPPSSPAPATTQHLPPSPQPQPRA
eukprot:COSAG01_NODE_3467_length_6056_cov_2.509820_9_plen_127_part_01